MYNICIVASVLTEIIIPLLSAIIGGSITMLGVVITILYESKKARKEYLEKNRPFFVVEDQGIPDVPCEKIKRIFVDDDNNKVVQPDQIVFLWDGMFISNMSNNLCLISYIRINGVEYKSFDNTPIKVGELCKITGYPYSIYVGKSIDNVSIGFLDRDFNLYEYRAVFEIKEYQNENDSISKYCNKAIYISLIDCRTNLAKKEKKGKRK